MKAIDIQLHTTTPSVMSFSELPSPLPWLLQERSPICFLTPFNLQTNRHPPPHSELRPPEHLDTSSLHSSSRPLERLPPTLAKPCISGSSANSVLTSHPAIHQGWTFFPWQLRIWEAQLMPPPPSSEVERPLISGSAPTTPLYTCTKQLLHWVAIALWHGNASLWLHPHHLASTNVLVH